MTNQIAILFLLSASCIAQSPIEHVVVVVKENHSFVNYFGTWPTDNVVSGRISTGETIALAHAAHRTLNPGHTWTNLHNAFNEGTMNRFDKICAKTEPLFRTSSIARAISRTTGLMRNGSG